MGTGQPERRPSSQKREKVILDMGSKTNIEAKDVIEIVQLLETGNIIVWVDGGWAVDALFTKQSRPHEDLDIVIQEKDVSKLRELLEERGFKDIERDDTSAWNFVLGDDLGRRVDVHAIVFDEKGNGLYGPREKGVMYPAESLTGCGMIQNKAVKCISAEYLMKFHSGYELDENDLKDMEALHNRFGLEYPKEHKKNNTVYQIVIQEKGKIILARVLTKFDLPFRRYPDFGVWSYLINADDGIVVFDAGSKYNSWFPLFRRLGKETKNAEAIIAVIKECFPGKGVREIILSHYHFDHSEAAPDLQRIAHKEFGFLPLIRIHQNDAGKKKLLGIFKSGLDVIFNKAGYSDWKTGKYVMAGERISGSDFMIEYTPGHTSGDISLVSDKYKIAVCGWWGKGIQNRWIDIIQAKIIDEDRSNLLTTIKKMKDTEYEVYFHHPQY